MMRSIARARRRAKPLLVVIMALFAAYLFYRGIATAPEGEPRIVEARIVAFQGVLDKAQAMGNIVQARVELPDGNVRLLSWPREYSDCRAGDQVRLVQFDNQLKVAMPVRCAPPDDEDSASVD